MRVIPTSRHGLMDHITAALLVSVPLINRWDMGSSQAIVLVVLGLSMFGYGLLTRYELGAVGLISMELHLALDLVVGIALLASPWYFGFAGSIYLPHVLLGICQLATTLISEGTPRDRWSRQA